MNNDLAIVVLAAGKGTRMQSDLPKVLHELKNKPLIFYVLDTALSLNPSNLTVVIGYLANIVRQNIENNYKDRVINFAYQEDQLGTGHAVKCGLNLINNVKNVLVLYGDVPLFSNETLVNLIHYHNLNNLDCTVLTADLDDPTGYGRIIKDKDNNLIKIVEEKDADENIKKIKEINSGIMIVKFEELKFALDQIKPINAQNEYYLTDIVYILKDAGKLVKSYKLKNSIEIYGVNTPSQLKALEDILSNLLSNKN